MFGKELVASDLDGTWGNDWTEGREQEATVIISGRTFAEWGLPRPDLPIYIRGVGAYGDRNHAGIFKAAMIQILGVTTYYEDDPDQAVLIRQRCPGVLVITPEDPVR